MENLPITEAKYSFDIDRFFSFLLKKWWIIFLAGLIGGLLGIAYATVQKPKYESRMTFALENSQGGISGVLNLAAEFGLNLGGMSSDLFSGDNIISILTSRKIIESVLLSSDTVNNKVVSLADRYNQINKVDYSKFKHLKGLALPPGNKENYSYLQDSLLFNIYNNIILSALIVSRPDKKLNIYEIKFKSSEERFTKIFTERLIDNASKFYIELKSKRSRETLEILESRAASMRNAAKGAISNQASIKDANVNPAFSSSQAQVQKYQLDGVAYGKAYEELFKNLEMARFQYLMDIPLFQVVDAPDYPMKNLKKGRLKTGIVGAISLGFVTTIAILLFFFYKSRKQVSVNK